MSPTPPKILQSFELVQTGNKIRLTDSDGSIYEGEILAAVQEKVSEKDAQTKVDQSYEFAFRVAGTSQQLNRPLIFTGEFALTNAMLGSQEKTLAPTGGALQKQSSGSSVGLIQGKVSIGGTNEFEISAITESLK